MKMRVGRFLSVISVIVVMVGVSASCRSLVEPVHSEEKTISTADGREFTVVFTEENVPDTEITITVSENGQRIAEDGSFDAYLDDYDYQNDFVNCWYQLINEYHSDAVDAYQFCWGSLYTVNKGDAYVLVPKHEYEAKCEKDAFFKNLLAQVG